jgi:hypothetical protein
VLGSLSNPGKDLANNSCMLDIVQSGANNNNCIYPLDPGDKVVCANLFNQVRLYSIEQFVPNFVHQMRH